MDGKEFAIMVVGIAFCISFGAVAFRYTESQIEIEAAKNGLQQCVIEFRTVWQKECK